MEDAVHTVADFHVRLFLKAVAEDLKSGRVLLEFVNEIENNAVGTSCTDDVRKSENPGVEAEGSNPTADEALSGLLACTVERNGHAGAVVFRCGHGSVLTVDNGT